MMSINGTACSVDSTWTPFTLLGSLDLDTMAECGPCFATVPVTCLRRKVIFFVPMEVLLCRVRSIYINSHILNVRKVHFEIRGLNIRLWRNTISFMIISAHMDTRYSQAVISEPLVTEFVICVLPACSINWWILQNVKTPSVCYCTSELFVLEL